MSERVLIANTRPATTKAGRPVAHLYSSNTRLQYPVLILYDISLLTEVGIDPDKLPPEGFHNRYWAHYEISERLTSQGNPYKDVVALEPIDRPATTTSTDTSAIVGELRAIKALLAELVTHLGPGSQSLSPSVPRPPDPTPPPQPPPGPTAEGFFDDVAAALDQAAPTPTPDKPSHTDGMTEQEARLAFYELTGKAIALEQIQFQLANDLASSANGDGWLKSLATLQAEVTKHVRENALPAQTRNGRSKLFKS